MTPLFFTPPLQDEDLVAGVRMYFDKALPYLLLYAREKAQAAKVGALEGRGGEGAAVGGLMLG